MPLVVLVLALFATACGNGADDGDAAADVDDTGGEPIPLGLVTDLTGRFVTVGRDILAATELAVERINDEGGINGVEIELIVRDTSGEPEQAVTAIRELAERGVFAVSGPLTSGEAQVVFAQAGNLGLPMISGTANQDGITELGDGWAFLNTATNTALFAEAIPVWMEEFEIESAVLVFDEEEPVSSAAVAVAIPAAAEGAGLEIVNIDSPVTFTRGQTDFSTTVQRIRDLDGDGLIVMSAPTEAGLLATELARQADDRPILGHPSQGTQSFYQSGGEQINDWFLPLIFDAGAEDPDVQDFVAAMEEAVEPPILAESANYYDQIRMIASILEDAGLDGSADPEAAREIIQVGLLSLSGFEGIAGTTDFAGGNEAEKTLHYVIVSRGEPAPLGE